MKRMSHPKKDVSDKDRKHHGRRDEDNRRRVVDLDYFNGGGHERRKHRERRTPGERRDDWVQVGDWKSVPAKHLGIDKKNDNQ